MQSSNTDGGTSRAPVREMSNPRYLRGLRQLENGESAGGACVTRKDLSALSFAPDACSYVERS